MDMRKFFIVTVAMMSAIVTEVNAQRPVGDTTAICSEHDYIYDTIYRIGWVKFPDGQHLPDPIYRYYQWHYYGNYTSAHDGQWEFEYPDFVDGGDVGRHISGIEYIAPLSDVKIIGLAACPYLTKNPNTLNGINGRYCSWQNWYADTSILLNDSLPVLDTTLAGRETEYLQLYLMDSTGGTSPPCCPGGVADRRPP